MKKGLLPYIKRAVQPKLPMCTQVKQGPHDLIMAAVDREMRGQIGDRVSETPCSALGNPEPRNTVQNIFGERFVLGVST